MKNRELLDIYSDYLISAVKQITSGELPLAFAAVIALTSPSALLAAIVALQVTDGVGVKCGGGCRR